MGRLAAGAVITVVDGNRATSAFPDKSIQKRLGLVRAERSALPKILARYGIGRICWMARRHGRELIRLEIRNN
jgi:hypothetical protein